MMRRISISVFIDLSPSAQWRHWECVSGEASRQKKGNREAAICYQRRKRDRYTSSVPAPMTQEIETHVGSRVEAAYEGTYDLLRFIASRRFRIPECDVRPLIHDVFV